MAELKLKETKELKIRITLLDEALGMMPGDPKIHETYIASKAPDAATVEEEVAAVGTEEVVEKTMTVFPRNADGDPFLWDYQLRGFFKDAIGMLRRVPSSKSSKVKNYKKVVDGLIFVDERQIPIHLPEGGTIGDCQRPLRAETAQGPRVALAHSESVPAGSWMQCTLILLDSSLEGVVRECLDYGRLRGIAQWRNAGKGRFTWQEI